ncbi:hypothetical protein KP509_20G069600 [Ceratopteris richardii]|uniref:SHSP domain-containing protein n=1 Tax=Ceratopteris richardii TaxID=49495 RepID=A0A8T2SG81_CERRI|nr:hypothetical protein KP509_20G069600 [Ceratopteris richardii]
MSTYSIPASVCLERKSFPADQKYQLLVHSRFLCKIMALSPFLLGASDIFDPFNIDSLLFGRRSSDRPSSYARDVAAVANTQVDWKETPEAHIFKANLPGLSREEVKVQVEEGRVLQISGERKKEETTQGEQWHRLERAHGSFLRRFRLPENVKVEEVKAVMENGVLTVTIPKAQKPSTKTIDIKCT